MIEKYICVLVVLGFCVKPFSLQPNVLPKDQIGQYVKSGKWKHIKTSTHLKNPIYVDIVSKYKLPGGVLFPRIKPSFKKHVDCAEILKDRPWRKNHDGVYTIDFKGKGNAKDVFCDMTTEGGGWTVIQRRFNESERFNRNWSEYKYGFGSPSREYWIGNEAIHTLTMNNKQELRIDLERKSGSKAHAKYSKFVVDSESNKYKLTVGGYTGNAGDGFQGLSKEGILNGMYFSTIDRDNDKHYGNCAHNFQGGWWYNKCYHSLPNADRRAYNRWYTTAWGRSTEALRASKMMIRPKCKTLKCKG